MQIKSSCLLESKYNPEHSHFSTFQALSAINHRQSLFTSCMSPHPLPPQSPSSHWAHRRIAATSSWPSHPWLTLKTSWDRELVQKEQENLGLHSLLCSLAHLCPAWHVRVAELDFLTTAAQWRSGWQSQCLQPGAVRSQSREVGCSVMWLFFCLMVSWWC